MTKYNPMSKEFQDECERLGLTGRQLVAKFRREGKYIEKGIYKDKRCEYTERQLLDILLQFYEDNGEPPTIRDFDNNSKYPNHSTYTRHFGSWSNALKLVELDVDSMIQKGILETSNRKGRLGEVLIRDHFEKYPVDLAGGNCNSHWDGICPNGMKYDVKSSGLDWTGRFWTFKTNNKYKKEIEIYYFLAFNEDYTKLKYGWRIPGKVAEKEHFRVGLNNSYEFNIENMKQYDITDKLREVLIKHGFLNIEI